MPVLMRSEVQNEYLFGLSEFVGESRFPSAFEIRSAKSLRKPPSKDGTCSSSLDINLFSDLLNCELSEAPITAIVRPSSVVSRWHSTFSVRSDKSPIAPSIP